MRSFLLLFAASCIFPYNAGNNSQVKSYETLIRETVMENYDRLSRPVGNMSGPVNVTIDPTLFTILEVTWNDPHLQWDPASYGDVEYIMVQRSTIWLPDIVILGKISMSAIEDKSSLALIFSNGTVLYSSDQVAIVSCQFDVVDFPYDTQNCSIQYSSWMYLTDGIVLFHRAIRYPLLAYYIENDEWTMRSYTNRSEDYAGGSTIFYDIKITRKPNYYITTFVWPTFLINCLSIIGIFSPFNESGEREEKVTMGLTTLLTLAVILMIIAGDMPASANGVPLLGLFIMVEIGLASIASVFSVFIMHLHSNWRNGTPVPHWLSKLTCLATKKRYSYEVSKKSSISSTNTQTWQNKKQTGRDSKNVPTIEPYKNICNKSSESLREKWNKVAGRVDLFLMIIFLMINVLVCVCYLAIGNSKLNN